MSWNWARAIVPLSSLLLWGVACSEVMVVPDGQGGSGAAAGDDDDGGSGNGKKTSSTGIDVDACKTLCDVSGPCLVKCGATCQSLQLAPCEAEGGALVACLGDGYDATSCTINGCQPEIDGFLACRSGSPPQCGVEGGVSSDELCSKKRSCDTGEEKALCDEIDGVAHCTCYLSSVAVATCTSAWSQDACNLEAGCCASFL